MDKSNSAISIKDNDITQVVKDYLAMVGQNVPQNITKKFIEICKVFNLNPLKKEIYLIPRKGGVSIVVGYEAYLKRAERSGKLDGWKVWTEGNSEENTLKACIQIKRKDWSEPFYHEVYYLEYKQDTKIWKTKPITMIKKVAIAQGFRLAFPEELGGLPYIIDETISEKEKEVEAEIITENETETETEKEDNKQNLTGSSSQQQSGTIVITINHIARIIKPELKELIKQRRMKTKEVIEFWKQYKGNQDRMIEALRKTKVS